MIEETPQPLFVTRFSLSPRTAIGQQTRHFIVGCQSARHLYWEDVDIRSVDERSIRLERPIVSRFAIFKRPGLVKRIVAGLHFSRWRNGLPDAGTRRALRELKDRTSIIYLAPLEESDAERMRVIVEEIGRPFIVHFWDLLDGSELKNSATRWLIEHAQQTYALVPEMGEALGYPNLPLLLFSRDDTQKRATAPRPGHSLKIVLVGNLQSYQSGMQTLPVADEVLKRKGINVEWIYIGRKSVLKKLAGPVTSLLHATGFLKSDVERDDRLSSCHIALMPGPNKDPGEDYRSRFSVPSRLLDFAAVGLPVVGLVHPRSATARFATELRETISMADGEILAETIALLADEAAWTRHSNSARALFERVKASDPVGTLALMLDQAQGISVPAE